MEVTTEAALQTIGELYLRNRLLNQQVAEMASELRRLQLRVDALELETVDAEVPSE